MKIRTKLIVSNILIVIIPLGMVLGLLGVFINGPGAQYWETMENIYNDKNGVYAAQSLLNTFEKQDSHYDMEKEMTSAGYHFAISVDGEEIYSNITGDDVRQAQNAVGELYDSNASFSVTKDKVTVVREVFRNHGYRYNMLAIHTKSIPVDKGNSYMERYIALYIGFIVLILVASVVMLNLVLTWWISRSILRPLKKLSQGSKLIRDGNLDFEMAYPNRDEMGEVIDDFDEMRKHLKESVDDRLRYEQYRKDLIIGVSHDLRTPLTSIKGYVEGLRDGIASSDAMKIKYYEAIESSIGSLEHLVSTLTDFSKTDFAEYGFDLKKLELNEFYADCADQLKAKHIKDNIEVSFESFPEKLYAEIDANEMERVNVNLLENTLKYRTGTHSNMTISLSRAGDSAVIKIADDGPGVSDKDTDRIFECFYRADASRTSPGNGSGIGLAVVKQIIEGQGGSVRAENENGLAVYITLPLSGGNEE